MICNFFVINNSKFSDITEDYFINILGYQDNNDVRSSFIGQDYLRDLKDLWVSSDILDHMCNMTSSENFKQRAKVKTFILNFQEISEIKYFIDLKYQDITNFMDMKMSNTFSPLQDKEDHPINLAKSVYEVKKQYTNKFLCNFSSGWYDVFTLSFLLEAKTTTHLVHQLCVKPLTREFSLLHFDSFLRLKDGSLSYEINNFQHKFKYTLNLKKFNTIVENMFLKDRQSWMLVRF